MGEILDAANWAVNPHPGESSGEFHPAEMIPWVLSVALVGQLWPVLVCAVYKSDHGNGRNPASQEEGEESRGIP